MSLYTSQCDMKCTGHCIHVTILSNYRSVVTVSVPSFNGSHKGRSPQKTTNQKCSFPSGCPPNHFKYDTWASFAPESSRNVSPSDSSATTIHLRGHSRRHTCCLNTHHSAIGQHHLIGFTSLTSQTYTIKRQIVGHRQLSTNPLQYSK